MGLQEQWVVAKKLQERLPKKLNEETTTNTTSAQHSQNQPEIVNLVRAWYSLLAALFMELGFVEVATRHAPRTCPRLQ